MSCRLLVVFSVLLLAGSICFGLADRNVRGQEMQNVESYSDDFSVDSGSWTLFGDAHIDQANQYLVLTESDYGRSGVAFFKAPIQGNFSASFRYKVGGGSHGDGFALFFYKQNYSNIDGGGSLGFSSAYSKIVPGYGVEFDAWQNIPYDFDQFKEGHQNPQGDPSERHIALIQDFSGNHLTYVNDSRVSDDAWHQATVDVQGSEVTVLVDHAVVLQWAGSLNRTFSGFGFCGATGGGGSDYHYIDDFSISSQNLRKPTLLTSCEGSKSGAAFEARINGNVTFNGTGIASVPILLSYSVTGGRSWQDLTLVTTRADGGYSAVWLPSVTGNYLLKAVFEGNESYLGAINIVSFALEPYTDLSVFSVTSNSNLSALLFDSARGELSFTVSGESGTMGYVEAYIPKSLIGHVAELKVYLDNAQMDYDVQSKGNSWLLYFTYHHSSHQVAITLGSTIANSPVTQQTTQSSQSALSPTPNATNTSYLDFLPIIAAAGLCAVAVTALAALYKKKKPIP